MANTNPILCKDCERKSVDLSHLGYIVHGCTADPDHPGMCIISYDDPDANKVPMHQLEAAFALAPSDVTPGFSAIQKRTILAIVNIFETGLVQGDYSKVTLLDGDNGHLTYGRSQTTLATGNLGKLIALYCKTEGARFRRLFEPFLQPLKNMDLSLDNNLSLQNILRAAADDPLMRDAQDIFFDSAYWEPALAAAAQRSITTPLGIAVVYDSTVHGSWERIAKLVDNEYGTAFKNEKEWVRRYIAKRLSWLSNHPNQLLRKARYRMDALGALASMEKWGLPLPLVVRDQEISLATLSSLPLNCYDGPAPGSRQLSVQNPECRGADVRLLQLALCMQGGQLVADGIFGDASRQALKTYQKQNGLPQTGVADADLSGALAHQV